MDHTKKLSLSLAVTMGLGIGGTSIAAMDDTGAQSGTEPSASVLSQDALAVYEPALVFSDGAWYAVSDGDWYSLGSDGNWYSMEDGSAVGSVTSDAASADAAGSVYAMDDGTLYSFEDGQWYVYVPVEYVVSPDSLASDPNDTVVYDVHLYDMNGNEMYNFSDGQWVSATPTADDDAPSYVVYLQ